MNAERLHAIMISLHQEITKSNTVGKMQELIGALQSVVNQPHPSHQQALSNALKAIYAATTDSASDAYSPAWRQILSELGGGELFGRSLKSEIENIFKRNQITPAVALEELQQLHKKLQAFKTALDQGISSLRHFKIGDEKLVAGQCEIGILIPRTAVENSLVGFSEELKELSFVLQVFSEVATGKRDELSIKTISSSDLLVYLNAAAPYAACVAIAIERVVALYKQLLEIKKLHKEILSQGVPATQVAGIEDHANQLMAIGIEKVAADIIEQFYKDRDKGRKNELMNGVRISLNKIANRIDKGFNLEVRFEPIAKNETPTQEDVELEKAIEIIRSATANMQFMKIEGQPILRLPEGKQK